MNQILILIIAVLVAALIVTTLMMFRYRRQIREVCRQLSFHNENRTNQEIRIDVRSKEMRLLQLRINQMFEQCNALEVQYRDSEETLKEVVTNISHDIRTPLTSINGYFQLLCESEDMEERAKYEKIIASRMEAMSMLLEQLFTYVRVQNGGITPNYETVDLKQLLCENLFEFYEDFKQKQIEPSITLPEEPCYMYADASMMTRIIQNILKNALVHGEREIEVCLRTETQKIHLDIRNYTAEEHCADPSMVFERFYQADKVRSRTSTGLGLCIAKKLTELMSGKIRAYYVQDSFGIEVTMDENPGEEKQ